MAKKKDQSVAPIGENTVLHLTIPPTLHQQAEIEVLTRLQATTSIPGFRKGKAPIALVRSSVSQATLIDRILSRVVPALYAEAVQRDGIAPLVPPKISIDDISANGEWLISATTAVAPVVELGDWKSILKKIKIDAPSKETTESSDDKDAVLTDTIFAALLKSISPKIAPLLIEAQTEKELENLARHLESHKISLETFLKQSGKTIEEIQQTYAANALVTLQLEFIIQAIENELKLPVLKEEIDALLGDGAQKLPAKQREHFATEATRVLLRRKTMDHLKSLVTT